MKKIVAGVLSLVIALASIVSFTGSARAESGPLITFEPGAYHTGDIGGQDGWSKTGPYDATVVSGGSVATFGSQSLRISNKVTSGSFGDQTFSKSLTNEAGETNAQDGGTFSGGDRQSNFEASFDITSTSSNVQPGLFLSVSPDRGDGARMSYLGFEDQDNGIHVIFYDYQDRGTKGSLANPADGCTGADDFISSDIATLNRSSVHNVKISMNFLDGPSNDVVKAYIDGVLKHTGTSWEDYFRWCTESGGGVVNNANADVSRTVDSLLFRAGGAAAPEATGYLFDNLQLSSFTPASPPTSKDQCKKDGWKSFNSPSFKNQGDCVSYVASHGKAKGNPILSLLRSLFN